MESLFFDYTLRTVALGAMVLGVCSGALGTYAVLRGQSLLGDAISHAALPGIALAFMLTGSKTPLVLVLGAAVAGWVGTYIILKIVAHTRIKYDTALGLVLSVFFGLGLVLLTFIQRQPDAAQAGLDRFLFGQAAAMVERDVWTLALIGSLALGVMVLFWKEFKILSFDPDYGASMGFPIPRLDVVVTFLMVIAIVLGLQMVGVVLMSAILVAPAAAARQWTNRMGVMVVLAGLFGAIAGVAGAVVSSVTAQLPTGPTIVLCAGVIVGISLLFAPNRGLAYNAVRIWKNRQRLQLRVVLANLYALAVQHPNLHHPHALGALQAMTADEASVGHNLRVLSDLGWVHEPSPGTWALTPAGVLEAKRMLESPAETW